VLISISSTLTALKVGLLKPVDGLINAIVPASHFKSGFARSKKSVLRLTSARKQRV